MRPGFVFPVILCATLCSSLCAPTSGAPAGYAILETAHAFRGRITYVARRTDAVRAPRIAGTLVMSRRGALIVLRSPQAG